MNKYLYSFFILLAFACKKEVGGKGPTGPQGPNGPDGGGVDTLTLSGNVTTYDEFGVKVSDQSGATIVAYNGKDSVTAKSDTAGDYSFPELARGTYNFSFIREGYGTMHLFGYSHVPGGNAHSPLQHVGLTQLPDKLAVQKITVTDNGSYNTAIVYLKASSNDYKVPYGNMLFLIGRDDKVSVSHYVYSLTAYMLPDAATGGYIAYFNKSSLGGLFSHYDPLYYYASTFTRWVSSESDARYSTDLGPGYYYVSPETGDFVYPNLSSQTLASQF